MKNTLIMISTTASQPIHRGCRRLAGRSRWNWLPGTP